MHQMNSPHLRKFRKWWDRSRKGVPSGEVHDAVTSVVKWLDTDNQFLTEQDLHHVRLYSNRLAQALSGRSFHHSVRDDRLKVNMIKAVIDTATSHIGASRPRALITTKGTKDVWKARKKAEGLTKFGDGLFYKTNQYAKGTKIFKDAAVMGRGFLYTGVDYKSRSIYTERVFPNEILVDSTESKYGPEHVRNMFRHKEISKQHAIDMFTSHLEGRAKTKAVDCIEEASLVREHSVVDGESMVDPISVMEAWHLPSYPGAKDGRHVICTDAGVLLDEVWEFDGFPISEFRWSDSLIGYWGIGLAEELSSLQIEINYLLQKVQRLMTLATTQIWAEDGSIVASKQNNEDMGVRFYSRGSQPPIFQAVQSVSPEYFHQIERLYQKGFESAGISQLSAAQKKPEGVESGEALRTLTEIESKRFRHVVQAYEQFHMDTFRRMTWAARQLDTYLRDQGEEGFKVLVPDSKGNMLEEISWKDVDLDEDSFTIQVFPTNILPAEPAGQIETLKAFGEINPEVQGELMHEMQFPDLESTLARLNSPNDIIDFYLDRMLEKGEPRSPTPYMDFGLAKRRMTLALLKAEVNGYPDEHIQLVQNFIEEMVALERADMMAQQGGQEMAPAVPPEMAAQAANAAPTPQMPPAPNLSMMGPTG